MPYVFSEAASRALTDEKRLVEDRRNNPVRGRSTKFRLMQQNMLAYTFDDFVPGFGPPAINSEAFTGLVGQPTRNARAEGDLFFGRDFSLTTSQVGKVEGDMFELLVAAVLWNTATRWNGYMRGAGWPASPRYSRPSVCDPSKQVLVLSLPRDYDWIRLLTVDAARSVSELREGLAERGLTLPTSTPDVVVIRRPQSLLIDFDVELENLGLDAQRALTMAHISAEGKVEPSDLLLGIALKKSLRSDRLYQPLYEANIMHLLLENYLNSTTHLTFEVHTLQSAGTGAVDSYRAATISHVAVGDPEPTRAVADLYEPTTPADLVRRMLRFLESALL